VRRTALVALLVSACADEPGPLWCDESGFRGSPCLAELEVDLPSVQYVFDHDGDGVDDFLAVRDGFAMLVRHTSAAPRYEVATSLDHGELSAGPYAVDDLDGNGRDEIATWSWSLPDDDSPRLRGAIFSLGPGMVPTILETIESNGGQLLFGDVDRDGRVDLLVPSQPDPDDPQAWSMTGHVRLGRADGGFEAPVELDGFGRGAWEVARIDHDEADDLVSFLRCDTCPHASVSTILISRRWSSP
jgi:hypothetical protein